MIYVNRLRFFPINDPLPGETGSYRFRHVLQHRTGDLSVTDQIIAF